MEMKDYRSEFTVYVVDDEESIRSIVNEALTQAGYNVQLFEDGEKAWSKIQSEAPHVVLSDIRMPGMSGIDLLSKIRSYSEDIQFIIMTSHASLDTALQAIKLGAYDYLHKPFEDLGDVIITVDRTCEKLFLQYQNEQLLEELEGKNKTLQSLNSRIAQEKEEMVQINGFMADLSKAQTTDQVIDALLKHTSNLTGGATCLYLKHLPSYSSFVLQQSININQSQYRGVGIDLRNIEPRDYLTKITQPMDLKEVDALAGEVFGKTVYHAVSVQTEEGVSGIFVVFDALEDLSVKRVFDSFLSIVKVSYYSAIMRQRMHDMAIKDPLTGLYNRRYFNQALEDEISRSRRTHYPVSLIYLDIDHFKKYNDNNGHQNGDELLKSISKLMQHTSRKNDIVARLGGEEFSIILPATDHMGAAIKAEKLRRLVEKTKWPFGQKQPMGFVSISLGVSEYPSHCKDAESLVKAADDALYQVKESTRNKVCLATVEPSFKIDFEPLKVPSPKSR